MATINSTNSTPTGRFTLALQTNLTEKYEYGRVADLGLNPRESSVLNRLGVHTLRELAYADLTKALKMPNCGQTTCQLLRQKQITVQKDFSIIASETNDVAELPIFFLPLYFADITLLHSMGITTIGELAWINPGIFLLMNKPENVVARFQELYSLARSEYPQACVGNDHTHWTRDVDEQGVATLPFFSGRTNPGFSVAAFHTTYYASRELAWLGLFRHKTLAVLHSAGVTTLGDLLLLTPAQVVIFPAQRVEWAQQRIKAFLLGSTVLLDTSSPERFVRSMLGTTSPTDSKQKIESVVLKLLGYSLDEIGKRYGRTRERIRQYVMTTRSLTLYGFTAARNILIDVLNSIGGCGTVESVRSALIERFKWSDQECTHEFVYALSKLLQNHVQHRKIRR